MQKPLLSIGMIFKNEIRCLERCMKSLQPLREAIPCELVMADTGSDDGSREIAEKYADVVFDFLWINDFSAARNAVMDRCSGEWYMTIDADEWLSEDFSGLVSFLTHSGGRDYATITIRNYKSPELDRSGMYSDFATGRLVRLSTGTRYVGAIHEHWVVDCDTLVIVDNVFFHHDGYVYEDAAAAKKKAERNLSLIRKELKAHPDNLRLMMQYIESDTGESPEYLDFVYKSVHSVKEKKDGWEMFGPSVLRHAVMAATTKKLPELEEWIALAEEMFPDSIFTKIDVQYLAMGNCWNKEEYEESVRRGEAYLHSVDDYVSGNFNRVDAVRSPLGMGSTFWIQSAKLFLVAAYLMVRQPEKCLDLLERLDTTIMDTKQVHDCVRDLTHLHSWSELDTAQVLTTIWNGIKKPVPSKEKAVERKSGFLQLAKDVFHPQYRAGEVDDEKYNRHAYTLFLPLLDKEDCELGIAAAVLETENLQELEKLLSRVENWDEFPIYALEHALLEGARFPIHSLSLEKMDFLAAHMARSDGPLAALAITAADGNFAANLQSLCWARGLALAAVKSCDWTDGEQGINLCRAFAKIEGAFLPRYYSFEMLSEENIQALPPLHRFGWYCAKAFRALDAGDSAGYVRLLRQGLETCPEMKPMVEFLLKQLEESRKVQATPELLSLAEQVRMLLSMYPADDPAVEALKRSAAYQQVAHLIEGPDLGVFGGLPQ